MTLPFGEGLGDDIGPHGAEAVEEVELDGRYVFYGQAERRLFVSRRSL